jgi:hypothetical protein
LILQAYHPDVPLTAGAWTGVPEKVYHALPELDQSRLKTLPDDPEKFQNPVKYTTRPMLFGSAGHCTILEPKSFYERYAISEFTAPSDFKRERAQLKKDRPGVALLTAEEGAQLLRIYKNAQKHKVLQEYLSGTAREVTIIFLYRGRMFKARLDAMRMINDSYLILDLKFTESAKPKKFAKTIEDWGLHFQAATYSLALKSQIDRPVKIYFGWIVIEPTTGKIALYHADEDDILDGLDEFNHALDLLEVYEKKNEFRTYPEDFTTIKRPYYARRRGRTA